MKELERQPASRTWELATRYKRLSLHKSCCLHFNRFCFVLYLQYYIQSEYSIIDCTLCIFGWYLENVCSWQNSSNLVFRCCFGSHNWSNKLLSYCKKALNGQEKNHDRSHREFFAFFFSAMLLRCCLVCIRSTMEMDDYRLKWFLHITEQTRLWNRSADSSLTSASGITLSIQRGSESELLKNYL